MGYLNGRLPDAALSSIAGGRLEHRAARAWNDGPAQAGLRPTGSRSSYRTYAEQEYFWSLYLSGKGNLAARPGTSNHGWGNAVDLADPWMAAWMHKHGAKYGWRKVEAFNEWWHFNYVGGYEARPSALRLLGKVRHRAAAILLKRRRARVSEGATGKGPRWRKTDRAVGKSYRRVRALYKRAHGRSARVLKRVLHDRDGNL